MNHENIVGAVASRIVRASRWVEETDPLEARLLKGSGQIVVAEPIRFVTLDPRA
jgi:hypothetical protein